MRCTTTNHHHHGADDQVVVDVVVDIGVARWSWWRTKWWFLCSRSSSIRRTPPIAGT
jgi:hypothetical protein